MHRVTDVELNESLREQGVTDVTVDSCGSLYKFDVTVTFAPLAARRGAAWRERACPHRSEVDREPD